MKNGRLYLCGETANRLAESGVPMNKTKNPTHHEFWVRSVSLRGREPHAIVFEWENQNGRIGIVGFDGLVNSISDVFLSECIEIEVYVDDGCISLEAIVYVDMDELDGKGVFLPKDVSEKIDEKETKWASHVKKRNAIRNAVRAGLKPEDLKRGNQISSCRFPRFLRTMRRIPNPEGETNER